MGSCLDTDTPMLPAHLDSLLSVEGTPSPNGQAIRDDAVPEVGQL